MIIASYPFQSTYQLLLKHKDFLEKQMVHEKSW